ncbi:MAG: VIT1/CCC1 transporter family protein [Sporichthyaceae bacterium]
MTDKDRSGAHAGELHSAGLGARLNRLRAGVLGANDGIVSIAGLVVGVAGADAGREPIATAGLAGLAAGAVSMALGEYVSVSSARDAERDQLAKERLELAEQPEHELAELAALYRAKGLSRQTADAVARELTAHDALGAHAEAELGIDPNALTDPVQAAAVSVLAFACGGALPLLAILAAPSGLRVGVTAVVVLTALVITGLLGARLGGAAPAPAIRRVVLGGAICMTLTYALGSLVGASI